MLSSNVLKVENIDKMVGEETDDKENNQIHDLLPKHPARILICGTSGAGKSNLLSVMILKQLVKSPQELLDKAGIEGMRRPEELSVIEFCALTRVLEKL